MTYSINLAENDIKRIIAEHIGNCKPENVFLRASENDSFYGGTVVTASVTLNGPMTSAFNKEAKTT
jgi:hypothetical protein